MMGFLVGMLRPRSHDMLGAAVDVVLASTSPSAFGGSHSVVSITSP